jgi:hypothetical protein
MEQYEQADLLVIDDDHDASRRPLPAGMPFLPFTKGSL